jgi:hypothetical protein
MNQLCKSHTIIAQGEIQQSYFTHHSLVHYEQDFSFATALARMD